MATAYTSDRKIGALESASTPLAAANELVINQNGDTLKTPLSAIEAKVFDAKTAVTAPTGTEVVVVRRTDDTLRQVALADIIPALNITDAKVSASAAIVDTKLATIATAGKVANSATTATSANTANAIVARDGSGNFSAGTITATLAGSATGNAATATALQTARTIAISGDVTGTATSFNGSANISIAAAITADTVVNADINSAAAIAHTKLANITAGQVLLGNASNVPTATALSGDVTVNSSGVTAIGSGVVVDADVNAAAAIGLSKLATGALPTGITVASANIVDGTIVNADINAAAAIDLSKLAAGALPSAITVASTNLVDGTIVNADINASAAIADTKLATISTAGKVSNSATTATNANTANAIVARDASGNFSAGTITANVAGNLTGNVTGNVTGNLSGTASAIADGTVSTNKIVDGAVTAGKLAAGAAIPAGAVMPFAMNSAPSGWLAADGSAVSRTTYSALWTALGTTSSPYGQGDGSTTFNLPDLRGYFVRGSGTNSDGTASGAFGAKQADALKSHTHPYSDYYERSAVSYANGLDGSATRLGVNGFSNTGLSTPRTTSATGDTETRPKNIAMLYCIKF
jgi:microcystin-dependent protein